MNLKSLLMELAYSLHRLTCVGQISAMRTIMTVFLSQSESQDSIEVFARDEGLLL